MTDVLYPIHRANTIFIKFKGVYKVIPFTDQYKYFLDKLDKIYKFRYSSQDKVEIEKVLELIEINDVFSGHNFNFINSQDLYCAIYENRGFNKMIGKKFINNFLSDSALNYSFCGITDINNIKEYYSNKIIYKKLDFCFLDLPRFIELVIKSKDVISDTSIYNYIITYVLNTQPGKLDFLINETR